MKLSIITVNLNNREGLRKTAESVVSQTYKDYEWIVIDGGSTDGSRELIEQYAEYISYWVSEPDKGIYNAMNKGILKAQGEYCFFLNSGDYLIDSNILDYVFSIQFEEDVVYGYLKFDRGDFVEIGSSPKNVTLRTLIEGTIHHTGNALIRNDAFSRWGLYDESLKIVSDWKWFLKSIGLGTATIKYIDVNMSICDGDGISETNVLLLNKERNKVIKEVVPERVLFDYIQYIELSKSAMDQIQHVRSTKTYRLGKAILNPIKAIVSFFSGIYYFVLNKICLIYLFFLRRKHRLPKYKGEERVIVSLTSWSKRIQNIPAVVNSILQNTIKPDIIVLNLSLEEFQNKDDDLPIEVQNLVKQRKIEIIWNEGNTRAFKKIIPTMKKYPFDIIIAIDDDFIYTSTFIETFLKMHEKYPNCPLSGNEIPICNVQGHSGCASLVKKQYYGDFLDILLDDKMIQIGMDDIYYPFCAALNGYYYKYVGVTFSDILRPYYPFCGLSSYLGDSKNIEMINYMLIYIKTKYHIILKDMSKPIISLSSVFDRSTDVTK